MNSQSTFQPTNQSTVQPAAVPVAEPAAGSVVGSAAGTGHTGEPWLASVASWAVLVASFGLSASTWIALGILAGFTGSVTIPVEQLPVGAVTLRQAWLLPVAFDGYVVVALVLWMSPVPARVAAFAKWNTYLAAGTGIAAQSAYHLLFTMSTTSEVWRVVLAAIVGAFPPAVAAGVVHMRALIRREGKPASVPATTTPTAPPVVSPTAPVPAIPPAPATVHTTVRPIPATTPTTPVPTVGSRPEPAPAPAAPAPTVTPSPAAVADRITANRTPSQAPSPADRSGSRPTRTPARKPTTPAARSAPSTTDIPVAASDAARTVSPTVSPAQLAWAARVAKEHRDQHGSPINAGQLAVALKVTSEQARQILAVLDLDATGPTQPIQAVNGSPKKAVR